MLAWAVAASIAPQLGSAILRSPIWPIDILAAHKLEMSDLRSASDLHSENAANGSSPASVALLSRMPSLVT
jgi:hypothetical protein